MFKADINCDMGEGMDNDASLMPYISSANIACGYHAGNVDTMYQTIDLALQNSVAIGAHISYLDKKNFGRTEMQLDPAALYELVHQQLYIITEVAAALNVPLHHVKPHGALYNQSARDRSIASVIAKAVYDFNPTLVLYGLSGSLSIAEARQLGLKTANEVFADRHYEDDGTLAPRSYPHALINDPVQAVKQVLQMIEEKTVTSASGKKIGVTADTICIHSDGVNAVNLAKSLYQALQQ